MKRILVRDALRKLFIAHDYLDVADDNVADSELDPATSDALEDIRSQLDDLRAAFRVVVDSAAPGERS